MFVLRHFFFAWIFPWVPKRLLSRFVGVLGCLRLGPFKWLILPLMVKGFGINMVEAEYPMGHYRSMNGLFTRRLKSGLRPIGGDWVHPADSQLTQFGKIERGEMIQAKGKLYPLHEFLGEDVLARQYEGGFYMTYYLCPADYHRVHAPRSGNLVSARHIPGLLWPVNNWSVQNINRLFCLNERVVLNFQSGQSKWSVVMVGATNVGQISVTHDPSIITNRWMWHAPTDRTYNPKIPVQVGEEIGIFHLGSTVIALFQDTPGLLALGTVKMGGRVS